MIRVEYIGLKPIKTDNVAGTATVWHGAGDVQEVKPEVWAKLRPYDTVWREAAAVVSDDRTSEDENSATLHRFPAGSLASAAKPADTPAPPKYGIEWEEGETTYSIALDDMDAEAIHEFLKDKGLKVDARIKNIDTLRAAAFKAATEA